MEYQQWFGTNKVSTKSVVQTFKNIESLKKRYVIDHDWVQNKPFEDNHPLIQLFL